MTALWQLFGRQVGSMALLVAMALLLAGGTARSLTEARRQQHLATGQLQAVQQAAQQHAAGIALLQQPRIAMLLEQGLARPVARAAWLPGLEATVPGYRIAARMPLADTPPIHGMRLHATALTVEFDAAHEPAFESVLARLKALPGYAVDRECVLERAERTLRARCTLYWLALAREAG